MRFVELHFFLGKGLYMFKRLGSRLAAYFANKKRVVSAAAFFNNFSPASLSEMPMKDKYLHAMCGILTRHAAGFNFTELGTTQESAERDAIYFKGRGFQTKIMPTSNGWVVFRVFW